MATPIGAFRGVVITTQDPAALGRIKVKVPNLFGDSVTDWAEPTIAGAVPPAPGTSVWVMFNGGDPTKPLYIAGSPAPDLTPYATKTGVETLTNKTISGVTNTFSAIPESAVTNLTTDLSTINTSINTINAALALLRNDYEVMTAMGGF